MFLQSTLTHCPQKKHHYLGQPPAKSENKAATQGTTHSLEQRPSQNAQPIRDQPQLKTNAGPRPRNRAAIPDKDFHNPTKSLISNYQSPFSLSQRACTLKLLPSMSKHHQCTHMEDCPEIRPETNCNRPISLMWIPRCIANLPTVEIVQLKKICHVMADLSLELHQRQYKLRRRTSDK